MRLPALHVQTGADSRTARQGSVTRRLEEDDPFTHEPWHLEIEYTGDDGAEYVVTYRFRWW